jgi:hypothetical protein
MPYRVDDFKIPMEHTPEIARGIGVVYGLYVLIEYELVPALRWIANISPEQAQVALETHKQFSGKIAYIRAVCDVVQPDWPRDVDVGRAFAAAALAASKIRNTYAHAAYEWSGVPAPEPALEQLAVRVQTNGLTGNVREEVATIQRLDAEIDFMKSLIVAMKNYSEARATDTPVNLQEIRALASLAPVPFQERSHVLDAQ